MAAIRCFEWRGRMRRKPYFLWNLTIFVFLFLDRLTQVARTPDYSYFDFNNPHSAILSVLVVAIFLSIQTQRLHDFGFSGGWIIGVNASMFLFTFLDPPLFLVETLSFAWAIGIGLVPPQASANKYGPNSDENSRFWEYEIPENQPSKPAS